MLQDCPACDRQVSSAAAACPHCGHPIGAPTDSARSERTLTTQATGKQAKRHQLLAGLVIAVGVIFIIGGSQSGGAPTPLVIGWSLFGVGFLWYFLARFYAWWHYG